ncbi:MAG: extracellular solute-binding protein [Anaerolineae bacterium]|nr:extracellular solute-binding protein [Anaerolineae bacterium]MCB0243959.1 extracellular solute-binding protein [Anaerolineae bacterium]
MKKWTTLLLILLIALTSILSACGTSNEPADTTAAEPTAMTEPTAAPEAAAAPEATEVPEPAAAAEPVDISMWALASVTEAGPPADDWIAYDRIRNELGINLHYTIIPPQGDGETKLNAAAAANDLPDLFMIVSTTNDRDNLRTYHDLGLIAPVDDMFAMMPERTKTHYNNPVLIDLDSFDGQAYGLPNPPGITNREGLVIRQDWLDNLGLEAPTTPAELLEVAKAFTFNDPDGNGQDDTYGIGAFIEGSGVGRRFNPIFGAYGVVDLWNFVDAADGNFGLNVRDPQYYEAMKTMIEFTDAGVIDPDWPTLTKDEFRARWKQGRTGIMWEDFAALTNKSNYTPFDDNFPDASWTPLPALTGPGGEHVYGLNEANFSTYAVSQKAADEGKKEAIARLLEWMATDGYYLIGFGEEGVNFNLDEDGYITLDGIDPDLAFNSPAMQPPTQLRGTAFYNTLAEISARYPNYETNNGREMTPIKTYLEFFQSQQWIEGFAKKLIPPPENAADFYRYYDEGILQFALGQKELTPESWAEYLAGLDSLGAVQFEEGARQTLTDAGLLP